MDNILFRGKIRDTDTGGSVLASSAQPPLCQHFIGTDLNKGDGDLIVCFFKLQVMGHIFMPHMSFTKLGLNNS